MGPTSLNPLNVISSAVTPAVMISAAAILISGISSKHTSMADRVRALTAEYRQPDVSQSRKNSIEQQLKRFEKRLDYIARSHLLLYLATVVFLIMVFAICLAQFFGQWQSMFLVLFVLGVAAMIAGIVYELLELWIANQTLSFEVNDTQATRDS